MDRVNSKYRLDKITAWVYFGAALLILSVGFRTVLRTADIDVEWMFSVTIGALIFEFCLLTFYAKSLHGEAKRLEAMDPESPQKVKDPVSTGSAIPEHVLNKIEELVSLNASNERAIKEASDSLKSISECISTMNEKNIQRLVQEELSRLAQSSIIGQKK